MKFVLIILYSQLNVFNANEPAFLLWNDDHVAQGFAWHEGTVSFGVPDHDREIYLDVKVVDDYPTIEDDALRVIRVPFDVKSKAMIATVIEDYPINIEAGKYSLEFRLFKGDKAPDKDKEYDYFIQLLFKKKQGDEKDDNIENEFLIIKKSGEMTSDIVITKEAEIANAQ